MNNKKYIAIIIYNLLGTKTQHTNILILKVYMFKFPLVHNKFLFSEKIKKTKFITQTCIR